jgi:hypothetical protein
MKLTIHLQLVLMSRKRRSYLHSPIRFHGLVLNLLSTGTALPIYLFSVANSSKREVILVPLKTRMAALLRAVTDSRVPVSMAHLYLGRVHGQNVLQLNLPVTIQKLERTSLSTIACHEDVPTKKGRNGQNRKARRC